MSIHEALSRGDLGEAIDLASSAVRERPLDRSARFTLIDLLAFADDWDRATKQLGVLEDAPDMEVYRLLVRSGRERSAFFNDGGSPPAWVIDPPPWAARHLEACRQLRLGDHTGARAGFDEAGGMASPAILVEVGGERFEGFRDLDDRLGPVLELVGPGGYYWVPWEDVRFLDVPPPETLRDLFWAPAKVALSQGPIGRVYLPTTYPGSRGAAELLQLGRETDWEDMGSGLATGLGLKVVLAGDRSFSLFELKDVRFLLPDDPSAGQSPGGPAGP